MSPSTTRSGGTTLPEKIGAGTGRSEPSSGDESPLTGTAKELLEVLDATNALLRTIDLEKLPDAIDVEELPNLVDLERLSDAIAEHDPDLLFDLRDLERVVNSRELWNSVDLLEFGGAKRTLDRELEDVVGEDTALESDSEAISDVKEFADSLRPGAKQALIQQGVTASIEEAREAVVEQHANLERLYESNRRRLGSTTGRRSTRNPTAVSLHPSGPLPNGVSSRLSTVPSKVPYTENDALPRIYGRRWRTAGTGREE